MKSNLSSMNVFVVILALAYLFISFTNSKLDDKTYKNEFINKYAVFQLLILKMLILRVKKLM